MSLRSFLVRGLLFGSLSSACALSCGSDDAKTVVRGQQDGEAGADLGVAGAVPGSAASAGEGGVATAGEGGVATAGEGGAATAGEGGVASAGEGGAATAGEGGAVIGGAAGAGGAVSSAPFRLYNTGVDDDGVVLDGGEVDPHYTLIESAESTVPGPDAVVATHIAEGYWFAQSEASKWIAPTPNQSYPGASPCNASGTYVYRTTFDLTGYDPETLTITGGWAADNSGADIRLNGTGLGKPAGSYNPLTAFTIESGFLPGINTLDFVVSDIGCPNGLRVELSASDVQALPEF